MKPNGIPENDAEADMLRAYIPTESLTKLALLRDEESDAYEKQRRDRDLAYVELAAAKERARRARLEAKRIQKKIDESWNKPLFERLDAARDAVWIEAAKSRAAAIAAGERPRWETLDQVKARQHAAKAEATFTV